MAERADRLTKDRRARDLIDQSIAACLKSTRLAHTRNALVLEHYIERGYVLPQYSDRATRTVRILHAQSARQRAATAKEVKTVSEQTVRRTLNGQGAWPRAGTKQHGILRALADGCDTRNAMAKRINDTPDNVSAHLCHLRQRGLVHVIGTRRIAESPYPTKIWALVKPHAVRAGHG